MGKPRRGRPKGSTNVAKSATIKIAKPAARKRNLSPEGRKRIADAMKLAAQAWQNPATARADFGKLLHQNPSYAVAHYNLALAEERLGRDDAAERELRSALALAPTYARAAFALGAVLLKEGRRREARDAFARATRDAAADPALANIAAAMRDSITI